jgi:transcriptional regulator with XRE-family HTH domain
MQNKENISLGEYMRRLREEKGVSLGAVEEKTQLSRSYISRLENLSRTNPTLDSISRLVQFYGIPFSTIAEFCDCGNTEGQVQKLDYILLKERYLFANLEASIDLKLILKDIILELENYCTKASVTRQDEVKLLEYIVLLRDRLLSA